MPATREYGKVPRPRYPDGWQRVRLGEVAYSPAEAIDLPVKARSEHAGMAMYRF